MAAHSLDVTRLQVEFPEIAFFAPNCRLHGMGNWNGTVEETETGEQVSGRCSVKSHMLGAE